MAEKRPRDLYDVVIIGGGPAGLAAAVYTARQGLTTAVVAGELGGQAQWASQIDNYLGFGLISGSELARHFRITWTASTSTRSRVSTSTRWCSAGGRFEIHSREGLQLQRARRDHRHRTRSRAPGRAR